MSETIKVVYEGHSPENKFFDEKVLTKTWALSRVADKYGKNNAWSVISSHWDLAQKGIKFVLLIDHGNTKEVFATYTDICECMKWKSFEFDENKISVIPTLLTDEEINEKLAPAIARGKEEMKKWLKDHPIEDDKDTDEKKLSTDDGEVIDDPEKLLDEDFGEVEEATEEV